MGFEVALASLPLITMLYHFSQRKIFLLLKVQINRHPFDCVPVPNHPHSQQVSSMLSLIYMSFLPDLCQMHLQIFVCSHIIRKFCFVGCCQTLLSKAQFGFSINNVC